jgi:hypothetical protein
VAVRLDDAKSFCHAHGLPYVRLITREVEAIGSCAATGALDMYDDWMLDASIETGGTINECSDDDVRTRPDLAPPNKNNKISEVQMSQGFGHRLFRLLVVTKPEHHMRKSKWKDSTFAYKSEKRRHCQSVSMAFKAGRRTSVADDIMLCCIVSCMLLKRIRENT